MLPWSGSNPPLMLAPMQGVTNRALRDTFAQRVRPDVVFTEFVRVRPGAKTSTAPGGRISKSDLAEATAAPPGVPLVVQVIGAADEGVVEATRDLVEAGVEHINVNMGCPWGRMTSVLSGGGMFRYPETVPPLLSSLREIVPGSLSVKTRGGLEAPDELLSLLPAFEDAGIDFLIVHPRSVSQKYRGSADHDVTRRVVEAARFPVIANGDIRDAAGASSALSTAGAAGLMLGRGAIADPWVFERIRGERGPLEDDDGFPTRMSALLTDLLEQYAALFHGDAQVLAKLKEVLAHIEHPGVRKRVKALRKARRLEAARDILAQP